MDYDGSPLVEGDDGAPTHYNANNLDGDVIFERLVSSHRNIKMVFSGHISSDNIVYRSDIGDEGNTVYSILVNPQDMDSAYNYQTGMIAMLYFSSGGKTVKVEYISATESLKAQESDSNAQDVLFGKKNQ